MQLYQPPRSTAIPSAIPRPSDQALEAWRLLLEAHHVLTRRLDAELRERHGFGLDWYDVLYQLSSAGGSLRMHELADRTLFSRTDVTRLVQRLEAAGMVERRSDEADRRGVNAVLTPAGRAALRRAAVTHLAGIQRLFGSAATSEELAAVTSLLARSVERSLKHGA